MAYYPRQSKQLITEITESDPKAEGRLATIARVSTIDVGILVVVVWAMVTKPGL